VPKAVELFPTTNDPLASPGERHDQMESLAKILMGFSRQTQLVAQARELAAGTGWQWKTPPSIERHWYAVAPGYTNGQIELLREALEGVGLRCSEPFDAEPERYIGDPEPHAVQFADGTWATSLVLRHWPREVPPGWLGQALGADEVVDIGLHLLPQDPARFARFLRRQKEWQTDTDAQHKDAANTLGVRDAEAVRMKLIARSDRPVKVAIALTVRARDKATLAARAEAVTYRLGLALAHVREPRWEHHHGLAATTLSGKMNLLGAWRLLDCTSVASTGIFQPATVNHTSGAPIGTSNGMLVKLDPFDWSLRSFGGLITGSVGSGKSFLLKLLLLGLHDVEKIVVEQSEPLEYRDIPDVRHVVLPEGTLAEQAAWLREFITNLWEESRRNPRPRLLVLDELWAWIKRPDLAELIGEIARRGRKFHLALWIATQQIEELLKDAKAVFDNAAVRIYLQQEQRDLSGLEVAARLSGPGRQFLRGAGRGQALLYVNGMLVPVTVQASPEQYPLLNTDPREVYSAA